jgi:hypothetical protein
MLLVEFQPSHRYSVDAILAKELGGRPIVKDTPVPVTRWPPTRIAPADRGVQLELYVCPHSTRMAQRSFALALQVVQVCYILALEQHRVESVRGF